MLSCTVECQPHRMLHALGREHRIAVVIHHPRDTQCPMYTPLSIMCAPCSETLHIYVDELNEGPCAFSKKDAMIIAAWISQHISNAKHDQLTIWISECTGTDISSAIACALDAYLNGLTHSVDAFLKDGTMLPDDRVFKLCISAFAHEQAITQKHGNDIRNASWDAYFENNHSAWHTRMASN